MKKVKIIWTFHDCWPITGHCAHFVSAKCSKWQNGCFHCEKKKEYPISLIGYLFLLNFVYNIFLTQYKLLTQK